MKMNVHLSILQLPHTDNLNFNQKSSKLLNNSNWLQDKEIKFKSATVKIVSTNTLLST